MNRLITILSWVGRISVMVAVWLVFAAIFNWVVLPVYTRQGTEIQVPDVRGRPLQDARAVFGRQGFRIVVDSERFDATAPRGTILDQFPPPGGSTKKGRRIHVWISEGPPMAQMPNVLTMSSEDAEFTVGNEGLAMTEHEYAFSDSVYEGLVLSQFPPPDSMISRSIEVTLTLSLGAEPDTYVMPDVMELPEDQAIYLIRKAGLQVADVHYERYVRRRRDAVMVQSPRAGTVLEKDAEVSLVINGDPSLNEPEEEEETEENDT